MPPLSTRPSKIGEVDSAPVSTLPAALSRNLCPSHASLFRSLVDDVLGHKAGDKVPMEKVVMLLWAFRDDPTVVKFMAQFVSKVRRSQTHVGI
jgi:hypothetical protein